MDPQDAIFSRYGPQRLQPIQTWQRLLDVYKRQALYRPRLPDRGCHLRYDLSVPASNYVADDLNQLRRISMTEVIHGL